MLTVGIFQFDIIWDKPIENIHKLDVYLSNLDKIPDLLVVPEMWLTGFNMNPKTCAIPINIPVMEKIGVVCEKYQIDIIGSVAIDEDKHYYNRALIHTPQGIIFQYDKKYLFSPSKENVVYTAGKEDRIIDYKNWNITCHICYDLRFPRYYSKENHPDLIIFMANWPTKRIHHWFALLRARAIENQCYVIGCNRVGKDHNNWNYPGKSVLFDFEGNTIFECQSREEIRLHSISKQKLIDYRNNLPFLQDKKY